MSDRIVPVGLRALAAALGSCALLVGMASADGETTQTAASSFTLDQPLYLQATQPDANSSAAATAAEPAPTPPAPRRPLMLAFEKMGIAKTLDDLGINVQGHIEVSYTYAPSNPPNNF